MKELSIFVDESGDFGAYNKFSQYYIIGLIFHNQSIDISDEIRHLNEKLRYLIDKDLCFHSEPMIRGEYIYRNIDIAVRKKSFKMYVWIFS